MRTVFLVTAFNNWGKSTLLYDLFAVRAFRADVPYLYDGQPFLVLTKSNDDLGKMRYEREYRDRLRKFKKSNGAPTYIASAFCPTREPRNNSITILRALYGADRIEMLLLEYKWCGHAKLLLREIEQYYADERNVTVHRVTSRSRDGKLASAKVIFSNGLRSGRASKSIKARP